MRKVIALCIAAMFVLGTATMAFGSTPPGLRGYEGQPGNQGGPNHHP